MGELFFNIVVGFSGEAYFQELSENGLLSPIKSLSEKSLTHVETDIPQMYTEVEFTCRFAQ